MVEKTLKRTQSLCPTCLKVIDASVVSRSRAVYLEKICPEHGATALRIWPDVDHYQWIMSFDFPPVPPRLTIRSGRDCPHGCGLCAHHLRRPTLVEIEVTRRCNLRCPVCFMSAEGNQADLSLEALRSMYASIFEEIGDVSLQITGGEPSVRRDLPDIIRLGRSVGFSAIEINTNGLAIAGQPGLLASLKEAGATGIYLQFDGLTAGVYSRLRGVNLLEEKLKVVECCRKTGIQAVLAMTVIRGQNDDQVGTVLDFALQNIDVVAGLALQPAFVSGRFEVGEREPLTMGDVIFLLALQSGGRIDPFDLWPLGCSHPLCSVGTYLVRKEGRGFFPVSRLISPKDYLREFSPDSPQGAVFADILDQRHECDGKGLSVVIMNYMDARTMDLQRLRECSMTVKTPDGGTVPFCLYHLTNTKGERGYEEPFVNGPYAARNERGLHGR